MPVFIRPARVTVDEGGGWLGAAAAVVALAVVISSAAVIIADVLTAILIALAALALAGTGVLVIILRRSGLRAPLPPGAARAPVSTTPARRVQAITGPLLSLSPPRVIAGTVEPAVTKETTS